MRIVSTAPFGRIAVHLAKATRPSLDPAGWCIPRCTRDGGLRMPVWRPAGPVRVFYRNWVFSGVWRARDAAHTVARGHGEWVAIDRANRPALWADAGATRPDEAMEHVLLLDRDPPDLQRARSGCRAELRRGRRRDAVAAALPERTRRSASPVARFARTGLPVEGATAETIATILTDRDPRAEEIAAVAAEAAGGGLLPHDGHRTAATRRRWTDVARTQALAGARGQ